jgi:2-oxoglutarate dehydrogenase E2 component (dihydrolipoamide succinyltransferase)
MILEMKVPSPGESITEVEIAQWLVSDGDFVEKDQAIAEVDSDKATLELPAENSGIITLKAEEGDSVAVGQVVCLINTDGEQKIDTDKKNNVELFSESVKENINETKENYASGSPSPAAKKILDEKGILPESIIGTGRNARITKEDAILAKPSMGSQTENQARENSRKKLSLLRRKLAQRLVTVKNETAMLTTFNEVDMNSIFSIRSEFKEQFKQKHEVGLGFMSFFTKAVVRALKLFPDVNSMIDGDYQIINDFYDISVAVSGPKGLMVPVLRNVEKMTFKDIESEIKRLAIRARDGEITVDEMTGGTFTISNGGVFGSMLSTPILNPPQSAILGMHNIVERPMAVEGEVLIRPVMYLALSYDHRIIDGKESVGFLVAIKEALEDPLNLLMDKNFKKALEL